MRRSAFLLVAVVMALGLLGLASGSSVSAQNTAPGNGDVAALGKLIFFDANLSVNRTQACAACHGPEVGFTGPHAQVNARGAVYPGALPNRFGNRKPPAAAYAGYSGPLHYDAAAGTWLGGMFWDGRATGAVLGDPLAEQAQGPFLNPLEQAMPDAHLLCARVAESSYAAMFKQVWGADALDCGHDVTGAYERIARSIAAYERSREVNPYTAKFDQFWDKAMAAGKDVTKIGFGNMRDANRWQVYRGLGFTDNELQGLAAFNDPNRADCAACHSLKPNADGYPIFTDYGYDNIGIPKNPNNPFYTMPRKWNPDGRNWIDYGLGGYLKTAGQATEVYQPELGKFKVPTLRNVDRRPAPNFVKAYGHNGYFKSLTEVVCFYHWRAMMDRGGMGGSGMDGGGMGGGGMGSGMICAGMGGGSMQKMFPAPEVDQNRATLATFNGMDGANIVAFLKTLSDGYYQR